MVNFGYTKDEFDQLTIREKAFIYKAWEDKKVRDTVLINKAVLNAIVNTRKKKHRRWIPLWTKPPRREENEEMRARLVKLVETSKTENKSWVDRIYAANGKLDQLSRLRMKKRREAR